MEQLEKIKIKLGIAVEDTSQDALLQEYLDDAKEYIQDISHLDSVPIQLLRTQNELAIIYYNKQGIEGQTAHSEGGISRAFDDVPESIRKKILAFRRLPR